MYLCGGSGSKIRSRLEGISDSKISLCTSVGVSGPKKFGLDLALLFRGTTIIITIISVSPRGSAKVKFSNDDESLAQGS